MALRYVSAKILRRRAEPTDYIPRFYWQITAKERVDCELFYLSYINKHGPYDESSRKEHHPRYKELCTSAFFVQRADVSLIGSRDS